MLTMGNHTPPAIAGAKRWRGKSMAIAAVMALLVGCSALPNRDLRKQYVEMVGHQGLTAVYPPREEFQVGDVFIRSYSTEDPTDLDSSAVVWLGTLQTMREAANDYMGTRINFADTNAPIADEKASLGQADFASSVVALNSGTRRTLPVVAFPTIKGSAASAGTLGGFGFLSSFGLGIGSAEQVSLDFTDTRAFGVPLGAAATAGKYEHEYIATVCRDVEGRSLAAIGFQRLGLVAESLEIPSAEMCGDGRNCDIAVITRTYLTRRLKFNYSSARIARFAAAARRSPLPENPSTVAVPGNLDVNINLDPDDNGAQVNELLTGLSKSVQSGGAQDAESIGLSFVGFQGNTLAFERTYLKPVAVAYDSINFDLAGGQQTCGLGAHPSED